LAAEAALATATRTADTDRAAGCIIVCTLAAGTTLIVEATCDI
jgi:hypothetical protein